MLRGIVTRAVDRAALKRYSVPRTRWATWWGEAEWKAHESYMTSMLLPPAVLDPQASGIAKPAQLGQLLENACDLLHLGRMPDADTLAAQAGYAIGGSEDGPAIAESIKLKFPAFQQAFEHARLKSSYDDLDNTKLQREWGSAQQLVFGRILADTLDLHPIYGVLLSPTGGIVGPGDNRLSAILENLSDDAKYRIVCRHGIVHDAFGYLFTHHQRGPGYTYIDRWPIFPGPDSPLADQFDGVRFWTMQVLRHARL